MKTRTSILALLASGVLLSTGGVAMGVSGLGSSDSAGNAQYQVKPEDTVKVQGVQAVSPSASGAPTVAGAESTSPSASGAPAQQGVQGVSAVAQPSAQQSLEDTGDSLPFTGYAAIPVLLLGLGLLGAGVMMRRRTADDRA